MMHTDYMLCTTRTRVNDPWKHRKKVDHGNIGKGAGWADAEVSD